MMLIGKILTEAMMHQQKHVTFLPAYGAEVRGGTANCQMVISDDLIYSPTVEMADSLLILNQPSYERFKKRLLADGIAFVNSSLVETDGEINPRALVSVRASDVANELGRPMVANVVLLGALNAVEGLLRHEDLENTLQKALRGKGEALWKTNQRALDLGRQEGERWMARPRKPGD